MIKEHHDLSQLIIHQIIETIEFVLGTISNTASYLRLWALSLAHAQLSRVFYQKTMESTIINGEISGFLFLIIGFIVFTLATFGVLMCMDLLECFLHTLRLHWVEFQNKFFKADGFKFKPFSFRSLIEK